MGYLTLYKQGHIHKFFYKLNKIRELFLALIYYALNEANNIALDEAVWIIEKIACQLKRKS